MENGSVNIGVLFSQSGPMAVTENAHIKGVLLACQEINEAGGINGKELKPIVLDPAGDDRKYADLATELLLEHKVNTIFGCCLSTSRKAVVPIVERFNGVLFYPSVYEGFEYSPNVIYGGAVPNQVVLPLLEYVFQNHGRRLALVGSDTLYAREINRIVKEFLADSDGEVAAEIYLPASTTSDRIKATLDQSISGRVDAVLATTVGQDSVALYSAHAQTGLAKRKVPIASLTTTEAELARMGPDARAGHLLVSPYMGSLNTDQNRKFAAKFKDRFDENETPGVYSEVAYALVNFYANAVRLGGETSTQSVLDSLSGAVFKAPGGDLFIDVETNHFTLRPHIGKSLPDGTYEIVWDGPNVVRPDPYLVSYDRSIDQYIAR